ncbi:hypothetical protein NDU88_007145 [Pleurodeles waltl]|uniref:Uncharacterized protein n=1 Tax=Pleurodeles waltl TaxID=8319 RepID=A0AAV7QN53_PLEWA|nr:hypothetical protein NDU88_007145 [Pleurodeles waltl]
MATARAFLHLEPALQQPQQQSNAHHPEESAILRLPAPSSCQGQIRNVRTLKARIPKTRDKEESKRAPVSFACQEKVQCARTEQIKYCLKIKQRRAAQR